MARAALAAAAAAARRPCLLACDNKRQRHGQWRKRRKQLKPSRCSWQRRGFRGFSEILKT
jgi:hypothetical protein